LRIIAYATKKIDNTVEICNSNGESVTSNNPADILTFLIEPYDDVIKICWSIDDTVAPILRLLGRSVCERIA